MDIFSIFFSMKVYCVFSLESPHRGDSNVYTQCTIFIVKKIIIPDLSKSADSGDIFPRDSRTSSKQPFSVRATEVMSWSKRFTWLGHPFLFKEGREHKFIEFDCNFYSLD